MKTNLCLPVSRRLVAAPWKSAASEKSLEAIREVLTGPVIALYFITDEQWAVLQPILELPKPRRFGRPRADARAVFEAILFILHTGYSMEVPAPELPA